MPPIAGTSQMPSKVAILPLLTLHPTSPYPRLISHLPCCFLLLPSPGSYTSSSPSSQPPCSWLPGIFYTMNRNCLLHCFKILCALTPPPQPCHREAIPTPWSGTGSLLGPRICPLQPHCLPYHMDGSWQLWAFTLAVNISHVPSLLMHPQLLFSGL